MKPTYTAEEIEAMVTNTDMKADEFITIANLINEEIGLYTAEEMPLLVKSAMMLFTRALISGHIKSNL